MPISWVCHQHPDTPFPGVDDLIRHQSAEGCRSSGHTTTYESQIEAQGGTPILIGGCRRCGTIGTLTDTGHCRDCVAADA